MLSINYLETDTRNNMKITKKELQELVTETVKKQLVTENAKMTRQHFQLIATVLNNTNAPENVKLAFAEALAKTNPGFNKERFLVAAGSLEYGI